MQTLPHAIGQIVVPEYFSPSRWVQMEACPLSVWAQKAAGLPETVEMIVGRLLHDVRARYASSPRGTDERPVSIVLRELLEEYEERLRKDPRTVCLTPLPDVFGRRKWLDIELRLGQWAATLPRKPTPSSTGGRRRVASSGAVAGLSFGYEQEWHVPSLRLRGRPDSSSITPDGHIEIVDYKSGNIFDRQGVHESIAAQLHLYALMAESVLGRRVRLFVEGRERVEIEWDEHVRTKTSERVQALSTKYAKGSVLPANEASNPGTHCVGCRLRAQCPRYLNDTPSWWSNDGQNPRPLPLDAWGRVRSLERDVAGRTLHLRDPVGRHVVISGIDGRHGIEDAQCGDEVYAFALAAGEDTLMHGRWLHPRAFHERSPSPRWPSSPCPQFYTRKVS